MTHLPDSPGNEFKVDLTRSVSHWDRRTKIRRGIWNYLVRPLYSCLPGRRNRLRPWLLRLMGAKIGRGCLIEPHVDILIPWNLDLDDCVVLGHHTRILNFTTVRIHSMTVISQYTYLCTGSHDYTHPHFPLIFKPITIGPECWIASGAFVGPGVSVGRGTVVGANAVVTRDLPEWMVCAGNPCKAIKPRIMRAE